MRWNRTWSLIKSDIWRRVDSDGRLRSIASFLNAALSPPCFAVILFRLQHYFYTNNIYIFAKLAAIANLILFSVEFGSQCEIDEGFLLGHANGAGFHDKTRIGKNCTVMHQSCFSFQNLSSPKESDYIILEDDVVVGAGARVLGPLTIGRGSIIGMNSVVTESVPPQSIIVGFPAKIIGSVQPEDRFPAETTFRKWQERTNCSLTDTFRLIREDLKNRARIKGKPFTRFAYLYLFFNPPALAVVIFRFCCWLDGHSFSFFAKLLNGLNVIFLKTEIGSKASIQGGLVLLHSNGVIINHQAKIGKNVIFDHHSTVAIGPRRGMDPENDFVEIGDNTFVGAGARIIGKLVIGENCVIGMNEVVTKSVADNSIYLKRVATPLPTPSQQIEKIVKKVPTFKRPISLKETTNLIRADINRRATLEMKKANFFFYCKVLLNPPALAVVIYRFSHFAYCKGWRLVGKILAVSNNVLFSVEIHPEAQIGPGFALAHASGMIIHEHSIIGKNCSFMYQNSVSVGLRPEYVGDQDYAILGDDIFLGLGARILGPVQIGDRSLISTNVVVNENAPDDSLIFGHSIS